MFSILQFSLILLKIILYRNTMMQNMIIVLLVLIIANMSLSGQNSVKKPWNNKQMAVVLTYDDGLNVHLDKVIPKLDSLDFKATFYIPGNAETFTNRLEDWRIVAQNGHELGNHTLFHPCAGVSKNRDWVKSDYDLDNYTITRIVDEIKLANTLLASIDGKVKRTFAYTCGDKVVDDSSFVDLIKDDFVAARGVSWKINKQNDMDLMDINCYSINGHTGEEMIKLVEQAKAENALVVFLFHGVGGEHTLNVPLVEHNKLVDYIKQNEQEIWVASLLEVSSYVYNLRGE